MARKQLLAVSMNTEMSKGRYKALLRVAERLADQFGSRVNAIAKMCEGSQIYRDEVERMKQRRGGERPTD